MFGDKHEYYLAAANSGPRWRLSLGRLNYCDRRPSTAYLAEVQSKIATAKAFTKLGPVCSWHACVAGRRCVVCFWRVCVCVGVIPSLNLLETTNGKQGTFFE